MSARLRHLRYRDLDGLARDRLDHMKDQLSTGDLDGPFLSYDFTADNTTNLITIAGEDTLAAAAPRVILVGTLPAELFAGTIYYLGDGGVNLYSLHDNPVSAAAGTEDLAFTDDGTGTLTIIFLD
jgi:hypothetical protein